MRSKEKSYFFAGFSLCFRRDLLILSVCLCLPCSLVLGTFPQGLVAVTVAAQVASMSARLSTPVLFFLPVTGSHSPQAWKSYLHSPAAHNDKSDASLGAFVWRSGGGGTVQESRPPAGTGHDAASFMQRNSQLQSANELQELCVILFEWSFDECM